MELIPMPLDQDTLMKYRARTFRTAPGARLTNQDEAVAYVNERGYVLFWPLKNFLMPSLWAAAAGDRPVPSEHDDPGHVTWGWKDGLLGKKRCYYGRVVRKRNTFIALDLLPYFYALSPNYGDQTQDYLIDYEAGRLTAAARQVYEALLEQGPLDAVALRKLAGLANRSADSEYNHALEVLQTSFRILPVGVAQAGAWNYAFIYDIVARHYPDLEERAHAIQEHDARRKLINGYLVSVGAATVKEIRRLFGVQPFNWGPETIERDLNRLEEQGELRQRVTIQGLGDPHVASAALIDPH